MMKRKHSPVWLICIVLTIALFLAGCSPRNQENIRYTVKMLQADHTEPLSAAEILEKIRPTVVDVISFTETGTSAGSGVLIGSAEEDATDEFFIITNHHVIEGGTSFQVEVLSIAADGNETTKVYDAALIGSSMKRDIAVLSIHAPKGAGLPIAAFINDSDEVKVGTEVFAIGNPLGILGGTVTHGIISATKREVNVGEIGTMTLLQTDASINGGNSGGGLFDIYGNLLGIINSGYESYNGQSLEGLNFAIPANDAKFAAESLIHTHEEENGKVIRYGYVEGDARMDLTFSTAALYSDSTLSARGNYLIAAASSSESPLYADWGTNAKAVVSITVNGETTDLSVEGGSAYSSTQLAGETIANVKAGDTVTIEYRDVLTRNMGGFGGFGFSYSYLDGEIKKATVIAQQYIYETK